MRNPGKLALGRRKARRGERGAREGGARRGAGIEVGRLVGLTASGAPLVQCAEGGDPVEARTTADLVAAHVGAEVTVQLVDGDPARPVVTGVLRPAARAGATPASLSVCLDGETLTLTAQREIVLRCGEASVALRADGRLVLRGREVLSRSSGTNKIKGGSVQIN